MADKKQFERNQQRAPYNTESSNALDQQRQLRQKLTVSERLELQKLQNQKEMQYNLLEEEEKEGSQKRVKSEHETSAAKDGNDSSRQVHNQQHNGHQEISAFDEGYNNQRRIQYSGNAMHKEESGYSQQHALKDKVETQYSQPYNVARVQGVINSLTQIENKSVGDDLIIESIRRLFNLVENQIEIQIQGMEVKINYQQIQQEMSREQNRNGLQTKFQFSQKYEKQIFQQKVSENIQPSISRINDYFIHLKGLVKNDDSSNKITGKMIIGVFTRHAKYHTKNQQLIGKLMYFDDFTYGLKGQHWDFSLELQRFYKSLLKELLTLRYDAITTVDKLEVECINGQVGGDQSQYTQISSGEINLNNFPANIQANDRIISSQSNYQQLSLEIIELKQIIENMKEQHQIEIEALKQLIEKERMERRVDQEQHAKKKELQAKVSELHAKERELLAKERGQDRASIEQQNQEIEQLNSQISSMKNQKQAKTANATQNRDFEISVDQNNQKIITFPKRTQNKQQNYVPITERIIPSTSQKQKK